MHTRELENTFLSLQDSIIELPPILENFEPDHTHWPFRDMPWVFRLTEPLYSFPGVDALLTLAYKRFLKSKGLNVRCITPQPPTFNLSFEPTTERMALLYLREIDFVLKAKSIRYGQPTQEAWDFQTSRIDGDNNLYHLFIPTLDDPYFKHHKHHSLDILSMPPESEQLLGAFVKYRQL